MSPLKERVAELIAISKAEQPEIPDWYITLACEKYIKDYEYDQFKEEIDEIIRNKQTELKHICSNSNIVAEDVPTD